MTLDNQTMALIAVGRRLPLMAGIVWNAMSERLCTVGQIINRSLRPLKLAEG
jgi:hypothetical protein